MPSLQALPVGLREANEFVAQHHRHSRPVRGMKFAIGVIHPADPVLWGVAIVGRPLARALGQRTTAEVLRCCVRPEAPRNSASFLYGASWRAWRAMGGRRLVTYTLQRESGESLRGAGATKAAELGPRDWSTERTDHLERAFQEVYAEPKFRWEWAA